MRGLLCLALMGTLLWGTACALAASSSSAGPAALQARQQQAQEERETLRKQISALQQRMQATEAEQADASRQLQASEQAISDLTRELVELESRQTALQAVLDQLAASRRQQEAALQEQQRALAAQMRAQHAGGLSPWSVLLSGRDPQELGRELGWLAYVARARTQALKSLQQTLADLAQLQQRTDAGLAELKTLQADAQARQQSLRQQEQAHRDTLASVAGQLRAERTQSQVLRGREKRLVELIGSLEKEIALAEQRRRAAEQAAREQAAREKAAQEKAVREQSARAQAAREQQAREQVAREQASDEPAERARQGDGQPPPSQAAAARHEVPAGGFPGLKKGLPLPVSGAMQGRFGAQRPEGGVWRGVVLRAPEGAPVQAVAPGRVVYAGWLAGFGNLLIVDHGQQYLSVYAYNQALLREVGDIVATGDTLARVGATGGQVEPGLYFELRHEGAPINPQLWLRQ